MNVTASKETSNFVIFANARSGSTSLAKLLNESVGVNLAMEPFHPNYSEWNPEERNYSEYIEDSETMNEALDELFDKYNAMKVLIYQFPPEIYLTMLKRQDLKILFLRRENLVKAAFSSLVAQQTNIWHKADLNEKAYEELGPIEAKKIEEIVEYVGGLNKGYEEFLRGNREGDYLPLVYEDLYSEDMRENRDMIAKICNFLKIELPPEDKIEEYMKPSKAKQNQDNLYAKIPNYEEIKREFNGAFT